MKDWYKNFVAREPVLVSQFVVWALANLGAYVVGHTHVVTQSQWDGLVTVLFPAISAAVLAVVAWVTRKFVTPVVNKF